MDTKTVLILLASVYGVASLECNTCKNVLDVALCNTTQLCHGGQVCFHNLTITRKVPLMNLGCMDIQQCGAHGTIPDAIIGREINERQTSNCFECCSTDQCNRVLCEHLILDGNWSEWSSWSQCDVTCEHGSKSRSRSCTNPAPQHGGLNCVGNGVEVQTCHRDLCPVRGGWSKWEEWGSCSVSCDIGLQRRTRNCSNPVPIRNGNPCFGYTPDVRQCMPGPCANGGWSDWSNWSSCSVTCGVGIHSKTRSCTNPHPSPFGKYCDGAGVDVESCATSECGQSHCKSNPCVNGHCYEVSSDYICTCNHGYEGRNCDVSLDYCQSNPCVHGTCFNRYMNYTCICPPGVGGFRCEVLATDCYDIKNMNIGHTTGVYAIELWNTHRYLDVLCDMDTAGGGWTVFQNRFDGFVDFYRNFANYTAGFGSMYGEFWLGLDFLHEIVSQGSSELRIDVTAADGSSGYETFGNFSISDGLNYTLHISRGTGTLGDQSSGLSYHNNMHFSTFDHDMDTYYANCSEKYHGAWWFKDCIGFDLNGIYFTPGTVDASSMSYYKFKGSYESLKSSKMMFRRV